MLTLTGMLILTFKVIELDVAGLPWVQAAFEVNTQVTNIQITWEYK